MAQGPILIFDKSSLESLNLDEAVLLDNFYLSNITPLFFVECLADLEKAIKSSSTPEQLVGSLADRTPDMQACVNVHHMTILKGELSRLFDLKSAHYRPHIAGGKPVQLGDSKGMFFQRSEEEEALNRWTHREFIELERGFAKKWRNALSQIDLDAMVKRVMGELGHWRKPKSLDEAKKIADTIIDYMDPEWLIGFGLDLLGVPEATEWVRNDWVSKRRPPLRDHLPYFIFMLTINIFFCLVLPAQLLRDIKPSHQIDLAYLYYLPFCTVFSSKDRFHNQVAPLFLTPFQTFVNGIELKEELKKLDEHYSGLPEDVLKLGLMTYAQEPPEDTFFLTTRLWDKYLPAWRNKPEDRPDLDDPAIQKELLEMVKKFTDQSDAVQPHDEQNIDKLDYVTIERRVRPRKGKWRRFSEEVEESVRKGENN
jgi:hypothetical protein